MCPGVEYSPFVLGGELFQSHFLQFGKTVLSLFPPPLFFLFLFLELLLFECWTWSTFLTVFFSTYCLFYLTFWEYSSALFSKFTAEFTISVVIYIFIYSSLLESLNIYLFILNFIDWFLEREEGGEGNIYLLFHLLLHSLVVLNIHYFILFILLRILITRFFLKFSSPHLICLLQRAFSVHLFWSLILNVFLECPLTFTGHSDYVRKLWHVAELSCLISAVGWPGQAIPRESQCHSESFPLGLVRALGRVL